MMTHSAFVPPCAIFGRLIDDGVELGEGVVVLHDRKIVGLEIFSSHSLARKLSLPGRRFRAPIISPGYIDLQVNGGFGCEVGDDPAALLALSRRLPETGVTAYLPTLVSRREGDYSSAFSAFAAAGAIMGGSPGGAARMLGVHLEGPLLSAGRAGAHDVEAIEAASAVAMTRILALAAQHSVTVSMVTLAPEREGALDLIASIRGAGAHVSLGHTDASYLDACSAIDAGARLATHTFNAMAPLHHREPGLLGAVLSDDRVTAMFIPDGVHVHPAVLKLAMRAKPPQRRGVVTDAVALAGGTTPHAVAAPGDASARLAGQPLHVDGSSARLADGTLAGSTMTFNRAIQNCLTLAELSTAEALRMGTAVPAAAISAQHQGRLRVGDPANVVLLDPALEVQATFIDGVVAFAKGGDIDAFRA